MDLVNSFVKLIITDNSFVRFLAFFVYHGRYFLYNLLTVRLQAMNSHLWKNKIYMCLDQKSWNEFIKRHQYELNKFWLFCQTCNSIVNEHISGSGFLLTALNYEIIFKAFTLLHNIISTFFFIQKTVPKLFLSFQIDHRENRINSQSMFQSTYS